MKRKYRHISAAIAWCALACGVDANNRPTSEERWTASGAQHEVTEPVELADRATGLSYGLPEAGQPSIADLLALLPDEKPGSHKLYSSSEQPLTCTNGSTEPAALPKTIRAVVTIPGTYYKKASICDQEEKFYGSFVVEDDTGGILVLRDSRVAEVQPGDVVDIVVHTIALTHYRGELDSRAILSYEMNILPTPKTVLYSSQPDPFEFEDIGKTQRVEGFVLENPSNLNFSTMILSDREFLSPNAQLSLEAQIDACQDKQENAMCEYSAIAIDRKGESRVLGNGISASTTGACVAINGESDDETVSTLACVAPYSSDYTRCVKTFCAPNCQSGSSCAGSDSANICLKNPASETPLREWSESVCNGQSEASACRVPAGLCKDASGERANPRVVCDSSSDCSDDQTCEFLVNNPEEPGVNSGYDGVCRFVPGRARLTCVVEEACENCEKYICPQLCKDYDPNRDGELVDYLRESMPNCWEVSLNQELLRRGYDLEGSKRIRATGPIIYGFDSRQNLVEKLGQIEVLE